MIFGERIHIPDSTETDHFENIQSTNWQTVRWKPPPPDSGIGWRVEFRSMEAQLTDFENAAFTVITVLISRVLLAFRLNLYVPLSKVLVASPNSASTIFNDDFRAQAQNLHAQLSEPHALKAARASIESQSSVEDKDQTE